MEAASLEACSWEEVEQDLTLKPPSQQGLGAFPGADVYFRWPSGGRTKEQGDWAACGMGLGPGLRGRW